MYHYLYWQVNEHIQKDCQSDKAKKVRLCVYKIMTFTHYYHKATFHTLFV